jgi:hypothetical protein
MTMQYQQISVPPLTDVQILTSYIGHFSYTDGGCEVSLDGATFYANPPGLVKAAEVRFPVNVYLRNTSSSVTRTAYLTTWY